MYNILSLWFFRLNQKDDFKRQTISYSETLTLNSALKDSTSTRCESKERSNHHNKELSTYKNIFCSNLQEDYEFFYDNSSSDFQINEINWDLSWTKPRKSSLMAPSSYDKMVPLSASVGKTSNCGMLFKAEPFIILVDLENSSTTVSLKSVIKSWNTTFIQNLEADFKSNVQESNYLGVILADAYIKGKRVQQNIPRAVEILENLPSKEAKLMLMKLAIQLEKYADMYYYYEHLAVAKCTCAVKETKQRKPKHCRQQSLSNPISSEICYKHISETLIWNAVSQIGDAQAKIYKRQASLSNFNPTLY